MTSSTRCWLLVLTPLLTSLLAGRYVPVDGWTLLANVLQVVLVPVALGVSSSRASTLRRPCRAPDASGGRACDRACGRNCGQSAGGAVASGRLLVLATLLLHSGGFLLGWLIPALMGESVPAQRTISIEVGMQNSGLAVVLARPVALPAHSQLCRVRFQP